MTDEDPFLRDFGISSADLHAQLTALEQQLSAMAKRVHERDDKITITHLVGSTELVPGFFEKIPIFARRQLMNPQYLVANDLDRIVNGGPAAVILAPPGNKTRPRA